MNKIRRIILAIALVLALSALTGALERQASASDHGERSTTVPGQPIAPVTPLGGVKPRVGQGYAWWYMEGLPWRDRDGGMRVLYSLNLPAGAQVTAEPQVYYSAQERRRYDEERRQKPPPPIFFRKQLEQRDGRYFMEVYSGSTQRFDVWARLELDGRPYYAQTSFSLGGSSNLPDSGVDEVNQLPDGPALALKNPNLNRLRLEEEAFFHLARPAGLIPASVSAFDQTGGIMALPQVREDGFFSYTPPYDQKLASGGYRGRNHIIMVARLTQDLGTITYYLPVHRNSQKSHSSEAYGVIVALVTAAICLLFVWLARRRFKYK